MIRYETRRPPPCKNNKARNETSRFANKSGMGPVESEQLQSGTTAAKSNRSCTSPLPPAYHRYRVALTVTPSRQLCRLSGCTSGPESFFFFSFFPFFFLASAFVYLFVYVVRDAENRNSATLLASILLRFGQDPKRER